MKKIATLGVAACMLLLPAYVFALQIKGVKFPEQITQEASQQKLVLNGAGVRAKFIFDIYIGALYLPERSDSIKKILDDGSPRRVVMHFLYDEIEKKKMHSAWTEGFEDNLTDAQFTGLQSEIDTFNAAFGNIVEGDVVIIDFLPDSNTVVRINNTEKTRISGADFQRALLSIWLGESPVDGRLKRAMLGRE
ncbi:chalcone isomerase family protein [Thiohalophilus sp.]|uniref:chalcone isomerase family protein n=1 Tax=Thiohalophilus sp. TaxID=3028392 RepID=UPI002ACE9A6D|nr:chalcone isomerase family protein [Thiohalophilus sp.]MDZ7661113.1 chalcone isomerase family protein [Thiohalophilus sp.]MDZ7803224.1 chalcone isomerase family protein [Thiohalophilus sp.]